MKTLLRLSLLSLVLFPIGCSHFQSSRLPANTDGSDLGNYVSQISEPQFMQDNKQALIGRIKLLDTLPAGSIAKIMTFMFDNGTTTRLLAVHMCKAALRGVKVQFTADSKTGDRPHIPDAFDGHAAHQVNEEVYQFLANCGVDITIHNHISEFEYLTTLKKAIPKLPRGDTWTEWFAGAGWIVGHKETAKRAAALQKMYAEFTELVAKTIEDLNLDDVAKKRAAVLKNEGAKFIAELFTTVLGSSKADRLTDIKPVLENFRDAFEKSEIKQIDPNNLRRFADALIKNIQAHPRLGEFYRNSRVFNRLNHRKLFYVESGDVKCMFLGGRNLGNHYLDWNVKGDEFMDVDVFSCNTQASIANNQEIYTKASDSFDAVFTNSDTLDVLGIKPQITKISKNPNFKYKYLYVPDEVKRDLFGNQAFEIDDQAAREPNQKLDLEISKAERTLPKPIAFTDNRPIVGIGIKEALNWRVQTAQWSPKKDYVRAELYGAIARETKRIYIETAYSEFSSVMRDFIEAALGRGVKVELVTNSIYVSDAGSKLIRLVMARWTREMLQKYSKNEQFTVKFARLGYGHMIHFKGASFACQSSSKGEKYRLNLIGSHNFHGRSGFSDKEHAIVWEQPATSECGSEYNSVAQDVGDMRHDFYKNDNKRQALSEYKTFQEEIEDALHSNKLSKNRRVVSEIAQELLYYGHKRGKKFEPEKDENGLAKLRAQDGFLRFLETLYDAGLSDIIGTLL
ncbi:MAG: phospholipase D-like domain-containing protein [Pseudobdellovibrionaceae bacterium]